MLEETLLADLVTDLPAAVRYERLVITLQSHFGCQAVALLQLELEQLRPVAAVGLQQEVLGRRFLIEQHPRLRTILQSRQAVHFSPDSELPDPYDGLVDGMLGQALPLHDCMGISLYVDGKCWGVLTLDALQAGTFSRLTILELQRFSLVVEAMLRVGALETMLRQTRLAATMPLDELCNTSNQELIGQAPNLLNVLNELHIVASTELPVLLLGETGVGKELFAKRLHQQSKHQHKVMVYVNCAALPEALAESELFGHRKGAFSGAHQDRAGKFEQADGGTLFLDEIGELPLSVQAKLLRVLQNGEIQRLGSDSYRQVKVRIIAATNRDLEAEVRLGNFRNDLFHRLSVYPLLIPALRERKTDIPLLAGHFLEQNRTRLGVRALRLSTDAQWALTQYGWPGNIRELEHAMSRAALKAISQSVNRHEILTISAAMLDLDLSASKTFKFNDTKRITDTSPISDNALPGDGVGLEHQSFDEVAVATPQLPLKLAIEQFQCQLIEKTLQNVAFNWAQAARLLDLDPSNLHKLANRLGLKAQRHGH